MTIHDIRHEIEQLEEVVGAEQETLNCLRFDLLGDNSVWIYEHKDGKLELEGKASDAMLTLLKDKGFTVIRESFSPGNACYINE